MIGKVSPILVGDANGGDNVVQRYLADKDLPKRHRPLYGRALVA
jgi:hypothetical protein